MAGRARPGALPRMNDDPAEGDGLHNDRTPRTITSPTSAGWAGIGADDADSVELKILLADGPDAAAMALTGLATPSWRARHMHLLDTPDLALALAGLEMRLRRGAQGRHDLTVRARHPWATSPPRRPRGARVELDVLPGAAWRTTQLRRDLHADVAAGLVAGQVAPVRLISADQRDWTRECLGPDRARRMVQTLTVHGPLVVHRLRVPSERFPAARARLEHCRYPSGRALVEFSARCVPDRAVVTAEAVREFLDEHDLLAAAEQRTKTAVWVEDLVGARR